MSVQITLRNTHQLTLDDLVGLVPTSPAAVELAELRARPLPCTVESFTALDSMAEGTALVPREITAETGHKAGMIGDFHETITLECLPCEGEGCESCHGPGQHRCHIPVSWSTIKAIHRKVVEIAEGCQ
ncbi:hypothetical protein [Halomonas elongata]|uniref:Uncharacterized protein n=1 Tax=Halomonas elongata (strain ATCC 33173 / DSM 2581 / NBRC 15536 / NCIMB 2198 / 1H9) TaxID=768066 RepID=A0ABZ0T506_HALED|nr:hypothetical protein [Halomonas elongata]WBF17853.1 hypothetical protein LM502_17575 [Halomonas elongata]WPU46698.1 hypothetical protein SR933_15825 [Halomonas elongata DSM 2581]